MEASLTCWRYWLADSGLSWVPDGHVGLVSIFGGLVFEDVGDLAYFLMVWRSCWIVPLGGAPGIRKEFQKSRCLSEMVAGERAMWEPRRRGIEGAW